MGIHEHFKIPKLHLLLHYVMYIKLFGSTDNYNTQYTERLHIDLAKGAYHATNHRDEYLQMTLWLEQREKVYHHDQYVTWWLASSPPQQQWHPDGWDVEHHRHLKMTQHPSVCGVSITSIINDYGATYFEDALAHFVVMHTHPDVQPHQIENLANDVFMTFCKLPAYHKIKFWNTDALGQENMADTLDSIHVWPS